MESSMLAFKAIAVLHTIAGYIFFALAASDGSQEFWAYKGRNPLAGDIRKYLAYFACWSLMGCGIAAFFIPVAAVALAWIALAFFLATGLVDFVANRRLPFVHRASVLSVLLRAVAAIALTSTRPPSLYGGHSA